METKLTLDKFPEVMQHLFDRIDQLEAIINNQQTATVKPRPKFVDTKGAMQITSKSANALRAQVSLGNLKAIKKGSRLYFDAEYLEDWLSGGKTEKGGSKI